MGRIKTPKVVAPAEALEDPEEWSYFADLELVQSRRSSVCLTYEHFTYTCDKSCVTLLTCPLYQRLIPQDEHLTKRCLKWQKRRYYKSDGVQKLPNKPQNYFLKTNEFNYHCRFYYDVLHHRFNGNF